MKDLFKQAVQPVLQKQTLFQLSQIKSFVDASLKETLSKNFENDADKIKYLLDTLYNIRDFVLAQTTENSLRINLLSQFDQIATEVQMGNFQQHQEKSLLMETEEKSEPDRLVSKKSEEGKIESTPNG